MVQLVLLLALDNTQSFLSLSVHLNMGLACEFVNPPQQGNACQTQHVDFRHNALPFP